MNTNDILWSAIIRCECSSTRIVGCGDVVIGYYFGRLGTRYCKPAVICNRCGAVIHIRVPEEVRLQIPDKIIVFDGRDDRLPEHRGKLGPLVQELGC